MAVEGSRSVLIVGAGAIGSLVGARLALARRPVILVGRPEPMRAIREQGLTLERPGHRPRTVRVLQAVSDWAELDAERLAGVGLAVLTTKAHDTEAAARELTAHLPSEVPLLVLQNGVGGVGRARGVVGSRPLLAGAITLLAVRPRPATVRGLNRHGGLGLAAVTASTEVLVGIASLFADSGFSTQVHADYRAMAWSKLLLNMLGNAVPAIVNLPPERVFSDLALCRLEITAFREALAVMRAQGLPPVALPGYPVPVYAWLLEHLPMAILHRVLPRLLAAGRAGKQPSLQIDLDAGRPHSEVEGLNGAVMQAGLELGVPVPANALIYRTLSAIVQGRIPRLAYAANPHSLLAPLR